MDPASVVVLVTVVTGVWMVFRSAYQMQELNRIEAAPQKPELEPIEDVIKRFKDNKRKHRQNSRDEWDAKFMEALPLKEHPDYFEVDTKTDEVERTHVYGGGRNAPLRTMEKRTNKFGSVYQLDIRPADGVAYVKHKDLKWEIPLEELLT